MLPATRMLELVEVAQAVEQAYCRAKPDFFDGDCRTVTSSDGKKAALGLEAKILANGHLVYKQIRELGGR